MNKVVSFSSGKGGVGKTSLVANMGRLLAKSGQRVLLVDGDWTLGKLRITLGVKAQWTIDQVLSGEIELENAITPVSENLFLLASPNGATDFNELTEVQRTQLFFEMEGLEDKFDWILLDHSSGIGQDVLHFAAAAHEHLILTTSEPTSYTDAYAIMKVLSKRFSITEFKLVVTMSHNLVESWGIIDRFADVARSKLGVKIKVVDVLDFDKRVSECLRQGDLFVNKYPESVLAQKLEKAIYTLCKGTQKQNGLRFFYGKTSNLLG